MSGNSQRWIALLGRRDGPTDGVGDYRIYLGATLGLHGYQLEIVRVPWPERGWGAALADLRQRAEDWRGCWVLLQYTALGWSRRGFPLRFLQVLRHIGARCLVVFHDALPSGGSRAQVGNLRLVVFGRGSAEAAPALRRELEVSGIETLVLGLLLPEDLTRELIHADVLLFVRGGVSSRRGLPVVGYRSEETAFPLTEAGVVLVASRDRVSLADALDRVLADDNWRQQLRTRSRAGQEQYFSWEVISELFLDLLARGTDQ
jgi:hypothetical protein